MRKTLLQVGLCVVVATAARAESSSEHPLMPTMRLAYDALERMNREVKDYTCILVKRERVAGRLLPHEHIAMSLREAQVRAGRVVVPFSVYLRFLGPEELRGREVLYVEGRNQGKMIAKNGGPRFSYVTTVVHPESDLALDRNRYPITEIGIKNLIRRLIENGRRLLGNARCDVNYYTGAKINDRMCTVIEVRNRVRRDEDEFWLARIFVDDQLQLPVRYVAYDWPEDERDEPPLIEEYTYLNLKLNPGLSDWDFDHRNENYGFRKDFDPSRSRKNLPPHLASRTDFRDATEEAHRVTASRSD
jgi:hypothetical protein